MTPTRADAADVPNSGEEADRLISLGVLPTHVMVLNDDGGGDAGETR